MLFLDFFGGNKAKAPTDVRQWIVSESSGDDNLPETGN